MKKTLAILLMALVVISLFVGCKKDPKVEVKTYEIGEKGPAGGYIFYDVDADNDSTNDGAGPDGLKSSECGWRYLEAAPSDASNSESSYFAWGPDGKNYGTKTAVGEGKKNTDLLLSQPKPTYTGTEAYAPEYYDAAKACADYGDNTDYDDWFLPSIDELSLMYKVLKAEKKVGNFQDDNYWSSSENATSDDRCAVCFLDGEVDDDAGGAGSFYFVRPIRQVK
jgi:hypothetical protein